MKIVWCAILISITMVIVGCADKPTIHLDEVINNIQNEKTVDKSIDQTWNELVNNVNTISDFEIIELFEKDRRIEASFYSVHPCQFVNCGIEVPEDSAEMDLYKEDPKRYTNQVCGDIAYNLQKSTIEQIDPGHKQKVVDTFIEDFMEGVATISLHEVNGFTSVVVDIKYNLSIVVSNEIATYDNTGKEISLREAMLQDECKFSSLTVKRCDQMIDIYCLSNGYLEKMILDLVEP